MSKFYLRKLGNCKRLGLYLVCCLFVVSCTKYNNTKTASTTSSSSGTGVGTGSTSGPSPLPPYGGSSSGSGSSGSSGSGSSSSNSLQSYIQPFIFTGANYAYITYNDSISLKTDGGYTSVNAGQGTLKYKIGSGSSSDPVYTYGYYFIRPYSSYTFVVFKSPQYSAAETLLYNDMTTPVSGTSQVRFVSLDPYTTTVPITYRVTNYIDNMWVSNRVFLDHRIDSNLANFRAITPGVSTVSFYYRDSSVFSFQNVFDAGKKYTIFSGAVGYTSSNRGQIPIPYYYVTRHN